MQRLQVLQQQLCAGQATHEITICPKELSKYLSHDNPELRAKIFEFLKVTERAVTVSKQLTACKYRLLLVIASLNALTIGSCGSRCFLVMDLGKILCPSNSRSRIPAHAYTPAGRHLQAPVQAVSDGAQGAHPAASQILCGPEVL